MATRQREGTVLEPAKAKVKPPKMFKVMLLNDDYTPMDFVVAVLQTFFSYGRVSAKQFWLVIFLKVKAFNLFPGYLFNAC